jgi:hypothetical protein
MGQDIAGFRKTKATFSKIHDICSEITMDPATAPEWKAVVDAFRSWMNSHHYDQSDPRGRVRDEVRRKAAALLDRPDLLTA